MRTPSPNNAAVEAEFNASELASLADHAVSTPSWVEVAQAGSTTPEDQQLLRLPWRPGMTVQDALLAAAAVAPGTALATLGLSARHETEPALGIFGRSVTLMQPLQAGDRVELYRPLQIDPKIARRGRVEAARAARAAQKQVARRAKGRDSGR